VVVYGIARYSFYLLKPEILLDWPGLPLLRWLLRIFHTDSGQKLSLLLFIWAVWWLPLAVFPVLLFAWTVQRRWLRVGGLIGLSLLVSLACVGWRVSVPLGNHGPLQHSSWDGWGMSWFVGAYGAGALALAALLLLPIVRWLARRIRAVLPERA
jgi:hypothetical protein